VHLELLEAGDALDDLGEAGLGLVLGRVLVVLALDVPGELGHRDLPLPEGVHHHRVAPDGQGVRVECRRASSWVQR
jgi:hypothetical protein